jgi:CMP-N-acetylneuraminic acid synthetase
LLSWVLGAALRAEHLDRVVVTDDAEIATLARRHGAATLDEPRALAGDTIGDLPVLCWALGALGLARGPVAHLRATSPFVRPKEIDEAVRWLVEHPALTSLRSVRPAREHPRKMYREAPTYAGARTLTPYTGRRHAANLPRQTLEPVWTPVGFVDVLRAEVVLGRDGPEGAMIGLWEAPDDGRAVDLDTEEQWIAAEQLAHDHGWTPVS